MTYCEWFFCCKANWFDGALRYGRRGGGLRVAAKRGVIGCGL